jgi:heat-inducible transcriptional repressor
MDELTERKQRILRAVVLEYVESAEPVGSSLLVERYQFGVGPATVRHELTEMSDRGYLDQPHTSAGRVPSDIGYRYFVNRLAQPELDARTARQIKELANADADLEGLLVETCKVLSRLTHYVSVAATFPEKEVEVLSVDFAGITKERLLMTVVFSNGLVENKIMDGRSDLTLGDLHALSVEFARAASGQGLKALSRRNAPSFESLAPRVAEIAQAAWKALRSVARNATSGKIVSEGTHFLLEQPEFRQDVSALSRIVSALENSTIVHEALDSANTSGPVRIGKEHSSEALHELSVVAGKFYVGEQEAGAIAVVGPKRMRYASAIPLVETAARALTDALTRLTR